MGKAVLAAAESQPRVRIKACVDSAHPPGSTGAAWSADLESLLGKNDIVIDFSSPAGTVAAAGVCAERGAGLVSGTTGLDSDQEERVRKAAERIPVVRAANFSLGMAALRIALRAAVGVLPSWDVEVVERHHRGKVDSPSGSALLLARDAASSRGMPGAPLRHGREGKAGPRPDDEIGIHAVRGGTWVGDHTVLLAGTGETLELRHIVQNRDSFASGALVAALFVAGARPGLYTLEDVLSAAAR